MYNLYMLYITYKINIFYIWVYTYFIYNII